MGIGLLIDTTKCNLCYKCHFKCHSFYDLKNTSPYDQEYVKFSSLTEQPQLDAYHYVVLQKYEVQKDSGTSVIGVSRRCMHCLNPACASVCPVGALHKHDDGAVSYNEQKCIGCRYCQNACPFDIPKFEWDEAWPKISKCTFCEGRLLQSDIPVCVEVCPTEAIIFGERVELLAEAHQRIENNPELYFDHVYGEHEAGGTSVMYISELAPGYLGFPETEEHEYPDYTWEFLSKIPLEIAVLTGILVGSVYFRKYRMDKKP